MGQKINPISVRLKVNRDQNSLWFSKTNYVRNLHKQILLKRYISKVFQISNLSLGPCYIQMFPKKVKIYPFFNSSNRLVSMNKKSYVFKRYIQSKYSKNRNLYINQFGRNQSLNESIVGSRKKDLLLWQNARPFIRMLDRLTRLKKNKKVGKNLNSKEAYSFKLKEKMDKREKSNVKIGDEIDTLRTELKKDIFRLSTLAKKSKKSIYDFKNDYDSENELKLKNFLDCQDKNQHYESLTYWFFYNLYLQSKKNGYLVNSKDVWFLFFQFILSKHIHYNLRHNFSRINLLRKLYLSTKYMNTLESSIEKGLVCNTSILPIKVDNEYKSAELLANYLSHQLAKNRSYRQVLKKVFQKAKKFSFLKGIRIACSGRLGGVELAKTEIKKMGQTSLNIFAEKIDYSSTKVLTKFGIIGIKVWVCYI